MDTKTASIQYQLDSLKLAVAQIDTMIVSETGVGWPAAMIICVGFIVLGYIVKLFVDI